MSLVFSNQLDSMDKISINIARAVAAALGMYQNSNSAALFPVSYGLALVFCPFPSVLAVFGMLVSGRGVSQDAKLRLHYSVKEAAAKPLANGSNRRCKVLK